jgi:hypothetical protein
VNLTVPALDETTELDFPLACADLAAAKRAVRVKDTPAARARVSRCVETIDAILDLGKAAGSARS